MSSQIHHSNKEFYLKSTCKNKNALIHKILKNRYKYPDFKVINKLIDFSRKNKQQIFIRIAVMMT